MRPKQVTSFFAVVLLGLCLASTRAYAPPADDAAASGAAVHFVPNSQTFWDFSKNWSTNYGPNYRDTLEQASNFLPCTGRYALCFASGPEPLPCKLRPDGRFADCKCTVRSGRNYVLITGILNYPVSFLQNKMVCAFGTGYVVSFLQNKILACAFGTGYVVRVVMVSSIECHNISDGIA